MDLSPLTGRASMPSSTIASRMSMGGMDHGSNNDCKISMLWNWDVINACFISSTWRITSRGMFAGSCIGVILLVMSLEFLRRAGYEFDKYIAGRSNIYSRRLQRIIMSPKSTSSSLGSPVETPIGPGNRAPRPTLLQHTARSLLHMVQFGVAYFIMLLAMYYNGYIIICILIGSFLGSFVFSWKSDAENDACKVTVCCG
ncbi:high affinity copper transporter [Blastomyces gilchristii SLH14081]|uniref:Copper transport protein n=1 Tax=Blastomyces gilchristii (strain SLH14081) TaxID=559298 RepID=A0A179UFC7_BLAGS|nr:high affinity copper transporter [Blastomyces gilchristii SLH14081]OAT05222.1 high affinity copper transporter [Blastomyces gilchristii SLH14081]